MGPLPIVLLSVSIAVLAALIIFIDVRLLSMRKKMRKDEEIMQELIDSTNSLVDAVENILNNTNKS